MSLRPLILGPEEHAAIETCVAFASLPENHYRPLSGDREPPGDKESYILTFGLPGRTYRCVFSLTEASDKNLYRHLSISVPEMQHTPSRAPHPLACWTLARAYGFTGWDGVSQQPPASWTVDLPGFCVAMWQRYP
ncbi:MAG TPA: hypothetical protein VK550_12415 [Polyangiaceae bacterium]|nr:hypothetical protein [Polyangiaceae bacterium]